MLHIYLHWPFCRSKCPYCDFNSHVRDGIDAGRWQDALIRDLGAFASETAGRTVASLFFGGGTPSLMPPATVAALIEAVAAGWPLADDVEITLEANPTTAEAAGFRGFRTAGVNRLSLGVQALDDQALAGLGRTHSAAEAVAAVALAARYFPRFSFDLIYARPGQTVTGWQQELGLALALAGEHLSLYQLTIEPGTAFSQRRIAAAGEEVGSALYETTQALTEAAGLPAYEISNHARPGGACRHNLAVWQGADYLGVGPGAHGRITAAGGTVATRQHRSPETWLAAVESGGSGLAERVALTAAERRLELVLQGLRLAGGIDRALFRRLTGGEPEDAVDRPALARLAADGYLSVDDAGIRATARGRLCLDAVLRALVV
jgi:oxygen-independent coproporphyrinogen-3 oxidase